MSSAFDAAERGLTKLQDAQRVNAENEEISSNVLNELYGQGDQLDRADATAKGLTNDAKLGTKLLKELKWRIFKEKLCLICGMLALIGADVGIGYFFFTCQKK
eukprot:CAMPEP_0171903942 /NCGR_PEP_ID=MMETSP0993-20121228/3654_1 /TAXON_ID=483369 /ORGANISM="non described non described, Strain CCMP2098" /LENGTH=102 /DNA_ID=CAMNT_0012534573 /DNA_START=39 /DNA_END=347 /DNA_ORIENTATION=-